MECGIQYVNLLIIEPIRRQASRTGTAQFSSKLAIPSIPQISLKYADLHLHTNWSDGHYTPQELVEEACKKGFSAIALTDHDTLGGLEEADSLAERHGMEIIPGVEITTWAGSKEYHILGYFIDRKNQALRDQLEFNRTQRLKRMKLMVEKLRVSGLKLDWEEFEKFLGQAVPGRLHLAHFMTEKKFTASPGDAFERYIGSNKNGYEKGAYITTAEAIKLIQGAGGVAVCAHPGLDGAEEGFSSLLKWGIQGLEVYYPKHSREQISRFDFFVKKHGLLVTGGSDCHGPRKARIQMGEIKFPYSGVETLRAAAHSARVILGK